MRKCRSNFINFPSDWNTCIKNASESPGKVLSFENNKWVHLTTFHTELKTCFHFVTNSKNNIFPTIPPPLFRDIHFLQYFIPKIYVILFFFFFKFIFSSTLFNVYSKYKKFSMTKLFLFYWAYYYSFNFIQHLKKIIPQRKKTKWVLGPIGPRATLSTKSVKKKSEVGRPVCYIEHDMTLRRLKLKTNRRST